MFLFKRYIDTETQVEKNIEVDEGYLSNDENFIIESKYLVMVDQEPVGFVNTNEEAISKIVQIIEGMKFKFILEGVKSFENWNHENRTCTLSSQDYNSFLSLERPRHIIRWKKITNNF